MNIIIRALLFCSIGMLTIPTISEASSLRRLAIKTFVKLIKCNNRNVLREVYKRSGVDRELRALIAHYKSKTFNKLPLVIGAVGTASGVVALKDYFTVHSITKNQKIDPNLFV